MEEIIENKIFEEIHIGESASIERLLLEEDILLFALMSGDVNPAHLDEDYAKDNLFKTVVAHGMWGGSLISTVLGTRLPGPGTIYLSQSLKFLKPVLIGDIITAAVTVTEKNSTNYHVTLDCVCRNQKGHAVISGVATVLAPREKVKRKQIQLSDVKKLLKL